MRGTVRCRSEPMMLFSPVQDYNLAASIFFVGVSDLCCYHGVLRPRQPISSSRCRRKS